MVQQAEADRICQEPGKASSGLRVGRVVAVLFSEEVTPESVQDKLKRELISHYALEENQVVGVALQPGRRVAYLALRDPVGPFVPQEIAFSQVSDLREQAMASQTVPIEATIEDGGGTLAGQILEADGTAVAFAEVRLFYECRLDEQPFWVGISSKNADGDGRYTWDYVRNLPAKIVAVDPATGELRELRFSVARSGQVLNVNVVFLGRGTVKGWTLAEDGVNCPGGFGGECAIAMMSTDVAGGFSFSEVPAGELRVYAFDQSQLQEGDAWVILPAEGARSVNVLLSGGLGTVQGVVLDADGNPVAGATVGGGLSLTTTDSEGKFTLTDVPVGHRPIVAVSQTLGSSGQVTVDLVPEGEPVGSTIVLGGTGSVYGTISQADGAPVSGLEVYLWKRGEGGSIQVVAQATTNSSGHYQMSQVPLSEYTLSAFLPDFSDGNVAPVALKFNRQSVRANVTFKGKGQVHGAIHDSDGETPAGRDVQVTFKSEAFRTICQQGSDGESQCQSIPQGIQQETVITDEEGRFWLPIVNPGTFTLTAEDTRVDSPTSGHGKARVKLGPD